MIRAYDTDDKRLVWVRRENNKGGWRGKEHAYLLFGKAPDELYLEAYGLSKGEWAITLKASQVTAFRVEMVTGSEASPLLGCISFLAVIIGQVVSAWTKMPVLRIDQDGAPEGQRTVLMYSGGYASLSETRQIARRIAAWLQDNGSTVAQPDLSIEKQWQTQYMPIVIGFALFFAIIVAVYLFLAPYTGWAR